MGFITEWHHASDVVNWTQTDNNIVLTVATSDPKGRVIVVHIGDFVGERQFSMNAVVEGDDASERFVNQFLALLAKHPNRTFTVFIQQECA